MQKIFTVRVNIAIAPTSEPQHAVEQHLREELNEGWCVAKITSLGIAALNENHNHPSLVYAWFVVVLEKAG